MFNPNAFLEGMNYTGDKGALIRSAQGQFTPQQTMRNPSNGMFRSGGAYDLINQNIMQGNEQQFKDALMKGAQNQMAASGDKAGFLAAGGQVDPNDPWSFYRGQAGDRLNQFSKQGNPADVYVQRLQQMMTGGFAPDDPSYQWRYNQGLQANERSLAARGLLNSGNAAIELQEYGQGMASQEYQAQFARMLNAMGSTDAVHNNAFNRLAEMAGINLNPAASDSIDNQAAGNAIQAQGQFMNNQVQNRDLNMQQGQWQDQMNMNRDYQQTLLRNLSPNYGAYTGQ